MRIASNQHGERRFCFMWHSKFSERDRIGRQAEEEFNQQVRCHCGGHFSFIGNLKAGFPDFTCDHCGQLVDVKSSPQSEKTGNLAISEIPWKNYAEDVLIVTRIKGKWIGEYRNHLQATRSQQPTHSERPTRFVLVACKQMQPIGQLGYRL